MRTKPTHSRLHTRVNLEAVVLLMAGLILATAGCSGSADDPTTTIAAPTTTAADTTTTAAPTTTAADTTTTAAATTSTAETATTIGTVSDADLSSDFPDHPFPVLDGYTTVLMNDGQFLDLEYQDVDIDTFIAFYEAWTTSQGGWSANEPNVEIGVLGTWVETASGDGITVFAHPDLPGTFIVSHVAS